MTIMYSANPLLEIAGLRHTIRVVVPGKRLPMDEAVFFTLWTKQHWNRIAMVDRSFSGSGTIQSILDTSLKMYNNYPELIEDCGQ